MINKKMYAFLFIVLLSFVSLSTFPTASFVEIPSESVVECVEQENNTEREAKEFSYLSFDSSYSISESKLDLTYKDKIYNLQINNNLLRPPIFS